MTAPPIALGIVAALAFVPGAHADAPVIPPPLIAGAASGIAPFAAHAALPHLDPPYHTGVAGAEQDWTDGEFEWRFTRWDGAPIPAADRVAALDLQNQTVYMDADQRAWNAACWLPSQGVYRASVRYRNREGLSSPWMHSQVIIVAANSRGRVYCRAGGHNSAGGTSWADAVRTLDAAIDRLDAAHSEIVVGAQDGPVQMLAPRVLNRPDVYIHAADESGAIIQTEFGTPPPTDPANRCAGAETVFAFTLMGAADRLVMKDLRFRPGPGADAGKPAGLWLAAEPLIENTTFFNCDHGDAGSDRLYENVWVAPENLTDPPAVPALWRAAAFIHCDRVGAGARTRGNTIYGLPSAWTFWGCAFGPPVDDPCDSTHTVRLTWRRDPPGPPAPPSSITDGTSEHVSMQFCRLDRGPGADTGTLLRVYVWRYFAAHGCAFEHGPVSLGQGDIDEYDNPRDVSRYTFRRCRFLFDSVGAGDYLDVHQGARELAFDACHFLTEHEDAPVINLRAWGGKTGFDETVERLSFSHCVFQLLVPNVVYDETSLNAAADPIATRFRNNLFVLPTGSGQGCAPFTIRSDSHPAGEYLFDGNVYSPLAPDAYATLAGEPVTWNDWLALPWVHDERREDNLVVPGTLLPYPGAVARSAGHAPASGGVRAWNGVLFSTLGKRCWAGAYQPAQPAPTGLVGGAAAGAAHLSWNTGSGAAWYWVHYDTQPGGSRFSAATPDATPAIEIGPLGPGTYYFRVMAVGHEGSLSDSSNEIPLAIP